MKSHPIELLGMSVDEVTNSAIVRNLNEKPTHSQVEDRLYLELPASGLSFDANLDGRVRAIFMYSAGHQDYQQYAGALPEGISFSDSREAVRARLGQPSASGTVRYVPVLGKGSIWDRFDRNSVSVHVEYTDNEKAIQLVTIMSGDAVPQ